MIKLGEKVSWYFWCPVFVQIDLDIHINKVIWQTFSNVHCKRCHLPSAQRNQKMLPTTPSDYFFHILGVRILLFSWRIVSIDSNHHIAIRIFDSKQITVGTLDGEHLSIGYTQDHQRLDGGFCVGMELWCCHIVEETGIGCSVENIEVFLCTNYSKNGLIRWWSWFYLTLTTSFGSSIGSPFST